MERSDDEPADWALLCPACAAETGLDDEQHVMEPTHDEIACVRCGALLVGFFYRVPQDAYTGMAPGPG